MLKIKTNNKRNIPYLTKLLIKLAPRVGAKFVVEDEWHIAGQIIYPNGVVRSMRYLTLDLNNVASADIARDKDYAKFFMKYHGYPVARSQTFFEDSWAKMLGSSRTISEAINYANKKGYPVMVKPNSKSQGTGVCVVHNDAELKNTLRKIFKIDRVALVEEYKPGHDYRVVVCDGEVISAYQRVALSVVGDGKSSILNLLKQKQRSFEKMGRDTRIDFEDIRIRLKLKKQKFSFKSILKKGEKVFLLDNANLSTGGDSVDMTDKIHKSFYKIATKLTADMGLRIAGVDIMITSGDITQDVKNCEYYIIEINAAPGLDHYVTTGAKQKKIVEAMYLKILKALGKKD